MLIVYYKYKFNRRVGIEEIYKHSIIYEKFQMLSHEPLYVNKNMPYCNIHGHIHSLEYDSKHYFNVSVECINYKPINFEEIKSL